MPLFFPNGLLCPSCTQPLNKIVHWKWGQSDGLKPRLIHNVEHTVLIVAAVYTFVCEHTMVATDPRILKMLQFEQLPFILLHRTGFTKGFINSIIQLVWGGMTIVQVEQYVVNCRREYIASLYVRLKLVVPETTSLSLNSVPFQLLQLPFPSNNVICKCFIAHFQEFEHTYSILMQQITADRFISLDHTFKIASNIGFQRADNKWVTQYQSVLFVMNEIGQVIAWQLTRSTSLDEVKSLLSNLAARLIRDGELLVYVDNCCTLRDKLICMMGSTTCSIQVKLDLFHAVQRITKTVSKRHPFLHQCMADLKLVFRDSNDLVKVRQLPTPDSETIGKNLDDFVKKWEACGVHEHWNNIITESTKKQVSALKKHVTKGCLSGIPKGAGTSRNEVFHRTLNMHFGRVSRIGIPLALALLTILIYQHNCKISEKVHNKSAEPLSLLRKKCSHEIRLE